MKKEIWKDVVGYEGLYQVSNLGNIFSLPKKWIDTNGSLFHGGNKMLSKTIANNGYYVCSLTKNKKRHTITIHRLVANAFLDNINNYEIVDHIDGNKLNNNVSNLRWCTLQQNNRFQNTKNKKHTSKYVGVFLIKKTKRYGSEVRYNGHREYLGSYLTEEEANNVYQKRLKEINENRI